MLLIIDNYDSFTFNLYQAFEALGVPTKVIKNDEMTFKEICAMKPSGIVLSPGPGRPENAGICIELIRKGANRFPILGVCLGHQAIAYAYGGKIISANPIYHGKKSTIFHSQKTLFQNMSNPFSGGRYHSLIVEKETLPSVFNIEAETEEGTMMAIQHKQYPLFGVQFHPESILTSEGSVFLEQFARLCSKDNQPIEAKIKKISDDLLNPKISDTTKESILMKLEAKKATAEEITCFIKIFKAKMNAVKVDVPVLDIAGTGGDGLKTVNLSTGAALLAASCGAFVAKHGNRKVSSHCGSADLLEAIKVPIDLPAEVIAQQIQNHRFAFCFAPLFHPALKALQSVRQSIKTPTIFNLLGPFLNPTYAQHYVLGVYSKALLPKFAEVLLKLGVKKSVVVHCQGMDEISTAGITDVAEVVDEKIHYYTVDPKDFGLPYTHMNELQGHSIAENAEILMKAFQGSKGPVADSLALNAGMGLYVYGLSKTIEEGFSLAKKNLENHAVMNLLEELRKCTPI